ncbi:MAG: Spy/CpxP family protein refolding chaperone [Psychromonas sp.]
MKTKTIKMLILASTLSVAGASYAVAATSQDSNKDTQHCTMMKEGGHGKHHGGHGKHRGDNKHKNMTFKKLDLSDQQKQQMQSIMVSSKKQMESNKLADKAKMQALMQAPTFNEVTAKALIEKKQSDRAARKLSTLKIHHQMYQLLTDEQKKEYDERPMKRNKR